jgi:histidine triad (HIT) family protein
MSERAIAYDPGNIFARILRGEVPCKKAFESEHALAFHDINPQAPVHILVIPKGAYVSLDDFSAKASAAEIVDFVRAVGEVARAAGVAQTGYRILANHGQDAHQDVAHFHVHIFAGRRLGRMITKA